MYRATHAEKKYQNVSNQHSRGKWLIQWTTSHKAWNTLVDCPSRDCNPDATEFHDDIIKWKHFPRNWPFVRGIHRSPVNSPYKGQWPGALMFSLICAWINAWVNNREAGDLRRNRAHYDVSVMSWQQVRPSMLRESPMTETSLGCVQCYEIVIKNVVHPCLHISTEKKYTKASD